jgi:hypothetical protein
MDRLGRFSFVVFVLLGVVGLAMAARCAVDPLGFFVA